MKNTGFRISRNVTRPAATLVSAFKGIPVANIGDNMNRRACLNARIRPMNNMALLGTAITLKTSPGDNLMLYSAIELAQPGDVIVVDAHGDMSNAIIGELMLTWAQKKGLAGIVIDGAVRDAAAIKNLKISVYASGVTPNGPFKNGPGEINVPVCCGGIVVKPGDIVVGDADGIVVIDPEDAQDVLAKAEATVEKEAGIMTAIEKNAWDISWVGKMLKDKACEVFVEE
ncbi:methyltransferase [Betaproteobacteria bacterium]|nr:methyltransferase [Betaproteobacteria bacterium]